MNIFNSVQEKNIDTIHNFCTFLKIIFSQRVLLLILHFDKIKNLHFLLELFWIQWTRIGGLRLPLSWPLPGCSLSSRLLMFLSLVEILKWKLAFSLLIIWLNKKLRQYRSSEGSKTDDGRLRLLQRARQTKWVAYPLWFTFYP